MDKFIPILKGLLISALPFLRGLAEFMGWVLVIYTAICLLIFVVSLFEYKKRFIDTPKSAQPVSGMFSKENYKDNLKTLGWVTLVYGFLSILLLIFI